MCINKTTNAHNTYRLCLLGIVDILFYLSACSAAVIVVVALVVVIVFSLHRLLLFIPLLILSTRLIVGSFCSC